MFPEGTRSRGRGLMPFKTGAFHAAIAAGVPIVPICVSTTSGNINLNRWNNGHVIVEMLAPVDTSKYGKENVRAGGPLPRADGGEDRRIDAEVAQRNAAKNKSLPSSKNTFLIGVQRR